MLSDSHHPETSLPLPVSFLSNSINLNLIYCDPGHDSSINIVYPGGPAVFNIRISTLPFVSLTWTSESTLIAAGHDCQPISFQGSEGGWQAVGSLDDTSAPKSAGPSKLAGTGRLNSASTLR